MKSETIIRKANIVDGSGGESYVSDVALQSGKIVAIGDNLSWEAKEEINAQGMVLSPGFIDMHGHSDLFLPCASSLENKLLQGITCEISGQCGLSPAPVALEHVKDLETYIGYSDGDGLIRPRGWKSMSTFDSYLRYAQTLPLGIHLSFLVGQGTVRLAALGAENRPATSRELDRMKGMVAEAMQSGAKGITTGLIYAPGVYTPHDELVELCKVAARYGGFYASHIRNEADHIVEAVNEALDIGREAQIGVEISHHKISGRRNWGKSKETLGLIDKARQDGLPVTLDLYPYCAGATHLFSALPPRWQAGGGAVMLARLREITDYAALEYELFHPENGWESLICDAGWNGVHIAYEGRSGSIEHFAEERGVSPVELFIKLILESQGSMPGIFFIAEESEMEQIMCHPQAMFGTDAGVAIPEMGNHPRIFGTFPRILHRYVREKHILTLEEAIHKMTGLPAQWAKLPGKGLIRQGYDADLVLFDPETIADGADFGTASTSNTGIRSVWVDGKRAVTDNVFTGVCAGRVLR